MSTNTDTSSNLINISESSPYYSGKCNLKCDYSFLYNLSSCNVTNVENTCLFFSYDNNPNGNPQASYNGIEYNVDIIVLYAPSYHLFNGQRTTAEIFICHIPVISGNAILNVSIPITSISNAMYSLITPSSQLINDMLKQSIQLVPKGGETATLNLPSYSLEYVVPKKRYFTYTDTTENVQWVVYGVNNAIQIIEGIAFELTKKILTNSTDFGRPNQSPLFMSQGPALDLQMTSSSDEIYIDCQPTGASTDETKVTYVTNSSSQNGVMFFIYVIFFLIVLFVIYMIFSYIMHPNKESLSFATIKNKFS